MKTLKYVGCFLLYYLIFAVVAVIGIFLCSLVVSLIDRIGILDLLLNLRIFELGLDYVIYVASFCAAMYCGMYVIDKVLDYSASKLYFVIGICFIASGVLFGIMNIISGASVTANLVSVFFGISHIIKSRDS